MEGQEFKALAEELLLPPKHALGMTAVLFPREGTWGYNVVSKERFYYRRQHSGRVLLTAIGALWADTYGLPTMRDFEDACFQLSLDSLFGSGGPGGAWGIQIYGQEQATYEEAADRLVALLETAKRGPPVPSTWSG